MDTGTTSVAEGEENFSSPGYFTSYARPVPVITTTKKKFQVQKVEDPPEVMRMKEEEEDNENSDKEVDDEDHIELDIRIDFDREDEENLDEFYVACGSPRSPFCASPLAPPLCSGEEAFYSGGYYDFNGESFPVEGFVGDDGYLYERALEEYDRATGGVSCALPLAYQRVDSSAILYEQRKKKPKFSGNYLIGDLIGEGSYSTVKEVLDTVTLERRAVKIMKKKRLRKIPNGEENVEREIKCLRRLNHENLIKLYDVIVDKEKAKICIFMDYCVGALQEVIDAAPEHRLPIHQAHGYFVQLISGLEYLHSQGIVHKDIKPGNLLITMDNVVKIIDLGVSAVLDRFSDDMISDGQGTPTFQPPEIAEGRPIFSGFKVDVWAAGVTLYNMTTGTYPFRAETVYLLMDCIIAYQLDIPATLGLMLIDLLRGMLRRDFDERMTIDEIKHHDWFISKHPIDAPAVKLPQKSTEHEDELLGAHQHQQRWRSSSVLPYLYQMQQMSRSNGEYSPSDEPFDDEEEFVTYSSSGGSISRLNELTVQSCRSNASKTSKASQRSFASLISSLKKTKQVARSTLGLNSFASNASVLGGCFGFGKRH